MGEATPTTTGTTRNATARPATSTRVFSFFGNTTNQGKFVSPKIYLRPVMINHVSFEGGFTVYPSFLVSFEYRRYLKSIVAKYRYFRNNP